MKVSELPYRRVTREEMTDGLQRVIERVKAAQSVEEILAARAEYLSLTTEYATAQSLSYMRYTINTVDPFYLAEKDYYDEIGPEVENLALQYTSAVLDSPFRKELETRSRRSCCAAWSCSGGACHRRSSTTWSRRTSS